MESWLKRTKANLIFDLFCECNAQHSANENFPDHGRYREAKENSNNNKFESILLIMKCLATENPVVAVFPSKKEN